MPVIISKKRDRDLGTNYVIYCTRCKSKFEELHSWMDIISIEQMYKRIDRCVNCELAETAEEIGQIKAFMGG